MAAVVEVNSIDELEHYHLIWKSLLQNTANASFLQSLDCLQYYWRQGGSEQKLRVLIVYSGGEPIGVLPLAVVTERTALGRIDVLTYPLHAWTDCYGPIGPHPTATLVAGLHYLRSSPRDWDLFDLRGIARAEGDHGRTLHALEVTGFRVQQRPWRRMAWVDMTQSWSSYWTNLGTQLRNSLRRLERMKDGWGDLRYVHYRPAGKAQGDAELRWDLLEACGVVNRLSQGETERDHQALVRLSPQFHRLAIEAGALDLHVLWLGGRPAAYIYNCHYRGRVVQLHSACDVLYSRRGLLRLLRLWALRSSFSAGDRLYQLEGKWFSELRRWSTRVVNSYRYTHYPASVPRAQLLRMKEWLVPS